MSTPLLRSLAVTRDFGSFRAVDAVSLELHPGEVVGLLGANGAGKTTLLRLLLGLISPTSGEVELMGGPPDRERRRSLGYVPQGLGLYRGLSVRENLAFSASSYGVPVPPVDGPLADVADVLVRDVPLGLQRRAAFTSALAHDPAVLVLDEPTSGVDALARAELWDTIRAKAVAGVGVLVTTHYMQEAEQCDRLLLMSEGRLVAEGSEADVVGGTTALAVRTDDWASAFGALDAADELVLLSGRSIRVADGDPERVGRVLAEAGISADVERVPATIEERMAELARGSR
ncbi:MAG TPA: ABC transporter ATP-binding protein [Candidatus Nanopelagicales bacterium]|nr:ABC transporter ATP-binding protein [Candidatus Nanopelagicales bacterium]